MAAVVPRRNLKEIPFGSFFGPSVLPSRAKQDIKNLLEKPKYGVQQPRSVDKIRESRDYSFLFSDDPKSSVPSNTDDVLDGSCTKNLAGISIRYKNRVLGQESSIPGGSCTKNLAGISAGSKIRVMGQESSKIIKKVRSKAEDTKNASRTAKGVVKRIISGVEVSKKPSDLGKPQKIREFGESVRRNLQQPRTLDQSNVRKRKYVTDEDATAFAMIRSMFPRYDPKKFHDDKDDIMESSLADIQKEERASAKWAKKEDEEELQKLINRKRSKSRL